jgi:hypothetical protein
MAAHDFSGTWHSTYHYTSTAKPGNFTSEYDVTIHSIGNQLIVESKPSPQGEYLLLRLMLDSGIATGTWHEQTSPKGDYQGVTYYGALQLVLSADEQSFKGKWVGFNRKMQVQQGDWELVRKPD